MVFAAALALQIRVPRISRIALFSAGFVLMHPLGAVVGIFSTGRVPTVGGS